MDLNICYFVVNVDHSQKIDCFCRGIPLTQSLSSFMQINCVQLHCVNFSTSLATRFCSKFGFWTTQFCKIKLSVTLYIVCCLHSASNKRMKGSQYKWKYQCTGVPKNLTLCCIKKFNTRRMARYIVFQHMGVFIWSTYLQNKQASSVDKIAISEIWNFQWLTDWLTHSLREDLIRKSTFSFGHCPKRGGGLPMPEFFGPFFTKLKSL